MKSIETFDRKIEELHKVFSFLKTNLDRYNIETKARLDMELSVEELFMNMLRYNSSSKNKIILSMEKQDGKIVLSLSDREEVPFDITKTDEVDFDDYFEKKKSGGLGIHLVKQLMDDIAFDHHDGISTITITKQV